MGNKFRASILAAFISTGLLAFVSTHEGTVTHAYPDTIKVATICTGHTKGVQLGQVATTDQCTQYLKEDLGEAGKVLAGTVIRELTQDQYNALASLVFNIGGKSFTRSRLLRKFNAGDCIGAANEFRRWVYAGGKRSAGLVKRREDERAMFIKDCDK